HLASYPSPSPPTISSDEPKLEATSPEAVNDQSSSQGDRQIKGTALTMSSLASMLISAVGAPVVDRTGLTGKYTINLAFAPMLGTPRDDEPLLTILAVLPQQLGLKLEKTKGSVEVLIIDRAEQPAEN
ncbi:MAG: TIGR03435 family protein, partial [Candidatus Solibacter sp.]